MCDPAAVAGFNRENFVNLGLLALRVGVGLNMALLHGVERVRHYSDRVSSFPDPLHMGHRYSLLLTVAAEFVGGILVTLGLAGRFGAFLLTFTLGLGLFTGDAGSTWRQRELTTLYLAGSLAILMLGCGRWALDPMLWKRLGKGGGGGKGSAASGKR
jgi:putative oxidoreductase